MNQAILLGRLTADPEIRYSQDQLCIARFTLAVNRRFKREGEPDADFIRCVVFGKTAETIEKHLGKGRKIGVVGRIQTGHYDDEGGRRVYTTDIIVESFDFADSRTNIPSDAENVSQGEKQPDADGFVNYSSGYDEQLPFE